MSLVEAGRLRGRVLAQGRAVRNFTVHHWDVEAAAHRSRAFSEREEGEFELAEVPRGPLEVRASAPGHAFSEVLRVDLRSGDPGELIFELRDEGRVRGQVVHAISGEPVGGADVTLFLHRDQTLLEAVGTLVRTDSEGRFVLSGLAPGENRFMVRASGFTPRTAVVMAHSGEDAQAGTLTLAPLQDLSVHLVGVSEAGPAAYLAELTGDEFHAPRPFGPDGSAVFVGVGSGRYTLRIHDPAGIWIDHDLELRAGARWAATLDLDAGDGEGIEVVVDLEGASPELIAAGINLHVATQVDGRTRERWLRLPDSLRTRIPGPLGDEVVVELYAHGPRVVGARRVRTAEHRHDPVRLRFDERGLSVRVVDADGEPAAGAWIQLRGPHAPATWTRLQPTDFAGRTHFGGLPDPPLFLDVSHAMHGISPGNRIDFRPDDRELVIRLDTRARLSLRVEDGAVPLPGVAPALATPEGAVLLYLSTTDPGGSTTSAPLAAGAYSAHIGSPGFWPTQVPIEMGAADTLAAIQVRRLGALALRVVTLEGLALAGARVELASQEFGVPVARWLAEGRVSASDGRLVSDERGELRLFGLPNGSYRYTLAVPGAEPHSGTVSVPPHAQGELELRVGD